MIAKAVLSKVGSFIAIGALIMALWWSLQKSEQYRHQSVMLESTIIDLHQEIKMAEIRLNDSISLYKAEVSNLSMTKKNLESLYGELLKVTKNKPKDVESIAEIVTVVHKVDTVIAEVDSFGGIKASLEDAFVNISVNVFPDRNTIIDYTMRDSLTVLNIQKKHSLLFGLIKWKEHKRTQVINHNPKATIVNVQTIDILE